MKQMLTRVLLAAILGVLLSAAPLPASQPIFSLAPLEIVLGGRQELVGLAVTSDGTTFVSDRGAGTVFRLAPSGQLTVAVSGLDRPSGLALDTAGRLLIAEEHAGRILRLEPNGTLTVLAAGIKSPRWLAVAPDGSIYVSAQRLIVPDLADEIEGRQILRLVPGVSLTVAASGIRHLEGLVQVESVLIAATRGLEGGPEAPGMLLAYPILPDGTLEMPQTLVGTGLNKPLGLSLDRLGALYVSSKELQLGANKFQQAIGKVHRDAHLTAFAAQLEDPRGMALGPDGSLYVADGGAGRLLRLRAPPPPILDSLPRFTNRSSFLLSGTTEPNGRVDIFVNETEAPSTSTSDTAGAFSVPVALTRNADNMLQVFASAHTGNGLTSPPAEAALTHDDQPPSVTILQPLGGSFARETTSLLARATDPGSGVAALAFTLDSAPPVTLSNPNPSVPFLASTRLDTTTVPDGPHALTTTAIDRAGNLGSASQALIIDNTPPDTQIMDGAGGEVSTMEAKFTFTGADNLTPAGNLLFAWRLDGGAFTTFSATTTAALTGLTDGPHILEVTARDLAGNEDPTPAQRTFTVSRLRVQITQPADGTTVPGGALLVQGTVEAGGAEVGVTVNGLAAAVQGKTFAALVPVTAATTALTALATTAAGAAATHVITTAVAASSGSAVLVHASPHSGVAPLTVSFSLLGSPAPATIELDADGDATIDFSGPSLEGQAFIYDQPGLYFPTVTVTDTQGNRQATRAVVQVFDLAILDPLLQAKWDAMKDTLRAGDIPRALMHVATTSRERYDEAFRLIASRLPQIDSILTSLTFVEAFGPETIYEATRTDAGLLKSFEVRFVRDEDGLWRIDAF